MPVIPATREAEAGESLEAEGRHCSEPRLYHCTLAWATQRDPVINSFTHKACNAVAFSTVTMLCNHCFCQVPKHQPRRKPCTHGIAAPCSTHPGHPDQFLSPQTPNARPSTETEPHTLCCLRTFGGAAPSSQVLRPPLTLAPFRAHFTSTSLGLSLGPPLRSGSPAHVLRNLRCPFLSIYHYCNYSSGRFHSCLL